MEGFGTGSYGQVTGVTMDNTRGTSREGTANSTVTVNYSDDTGDHQQTFSGLTAYDADALYEMFGSMVGKGWVDDFNGNGFLDEWLEAAQLVYRDPHEDRFDQLQMNTAAFDFSRPDMNFGNMHFQPQLGDLSVQSDMLF
jgi:hypothetical protein